MPSPKVLLAGWDAADWKIIRPLLEAGKMPHIERLVSCGTSGQISTLHPPLSPMLWTSIATSKRPFKHGIHGFSEPAPDGSGVRPITNLSRKTKAVWNILSQNGLRGVVVGWWPSHPAEPINGVMVSDHYHRVRGPLQERWDLLAGAVYPTELAGKLAALRMHPDQLLPRMVEPFVPLAREIDQDRDRRLAVLLRTLAEAMSVQAAALWLLDQAQWDFFAVSFDSLDHFCHAFMRYHPPRQAWIGERDFELYHNVVSMAYQLQDEMLGALLQKAGEDTTVILLSDHGFHPDHLRPASIPDIPAGPAVEHRDFGIFAASGPGIRENELLHGASVLDAAPTILTLLGLPVGDDMDGRVLSEVFVEPPSLARIPSWDEIPGPDGRHPPHVRLDPVAAQEALEQMIALGYITPPGENGQAAANHTARELRFNLGEAYQDAGRHREAREIFTELWNADPNEQRFAVRLFVSCQALVLHEEMRRIVEDLDGRRRELASWTDSARSEPALADYLKAQLLTAERRYAEALHLLEQLAEKHGVTTDLCLQIADLYLRLGRAQDAREVCRNVLAIDPDSALAHLVYAACSFCGSGLPMRPIQLSTRCKGLIRIRWRTSCWAARWREGRSIDGPRMRFVPPFRSIRIFRRLTSAWQLYWSTWGKWNPPASTGASHVRSAKALRGRCSPRSRKTWLARQILCWGRTQRLRRRRCPRFRNASSL
jgi:hypothetical protein